MVVFTDEQIKMSRIQKTGHDSPFSVIDHGEGWIVVEKPPHITIHNDPGQDLCSLMARYLQLNNTIGLDPQFGLHAVNRLDRNTSGLVLLAGRRDVFEYLSGQFGQRVVEKTYLAVVHGTIPMKPDKQWGQWTWPLTKKAAGRACIQGRGKYAVCVTRYRTLRLTWRYTLLECILDTGRKHQIRRHAALAGHPVLGDLRYGSKRACRYLAKNHHFNRLALHAARLSIIPPDTSKPRCINSPQFPPDIQKLIDEST